jgi:hypothetical protein
VSGEAGSISKMARIAAIAPDLLFASKIDATLSAAGHEVTIVSGADGLPADAELVIVDLDAAGAEHVGGGVPLLGFYSHVDVATKEQADRAGYDLVVPRSRMAREMQALVARLVGG